MQAAASGIYIYPREVPKLLRNRQPFLQYPETIESAAAERATRSQDPTLPIPHKLADLVTAGADLPILSPIRAPLPAAEAQPTHPHASNVQARTAASVGAGLGRHIRHVLRHRLVMHRPVVDPDLQIQRRQAKTPWTACRQFPQTSLPCDSARISYSSTVARDRDSTAW